MSANYTTNETFNGLGTFNIGVPEAGNYNIQGSITLPTIQGGDAADSQVVVTIKINSGSTIYTGPAGCKGFQTTHTASANDILNIILSSGAAVDQPINVIKTTASISEI